MVRGQVEVPPPETVGSFDDYYRSDKTPLIGFVLKLGAEPVEAEDAAQDAMEEIFMRWDRIGGSNPAAYARRVAERKYVRSRARTGIELEKLRLVDWAAERAFPGVEQVLLRDQARWLIQIMQDLPYEQRRVFAWHADGFGTAEIAGSIGKPESTVRSNLRHARAAVRKALAARVPSNTSATGRKEAGQ
ncbi:RNA polymerase sigma factor [Actinoplanes sp. NPDC049668]|uniref:RNA polymerase sigma factor n=1 Tax=unclassified Actinoplanes TaxID=2626549 RepID=UPI0033A83485